MSRIHGYFSVHFTDDIYLLPVIYLSIFFEVNDMFDFEEELKKLPHVPGVYLMHDAGDHIIYVGKAIDLYNRVHQYFQTGY